MIAYLSKYPLYGYNAPKYIIAHIELFSILNFYLFYNMQR